MSPQERKQLKKELEEDESDPFTIPLPLTTQMVQPPPYKGSDPEWKMFIKIAKDQDAMDNIRKTLAESARMAIANHPQLKRFGRDLKVRKYWLDFHFPYRPPPTFERQVRDRFNFGVETEECFVAEGLDFVHLGIYHRAMQAELQFYNQLLRARGPVARRPDRCSTNPRYPLGKNPQAARQGATQSARRLPQDAIGGRTRNCVIYFHAATLGVISAFIHDLPEPSGPGPKAGGAGSDKAPPRARDVYGVRLMAEHTSGPWQSFKKKFGQSWKPAGNLPPRGSIGVSGMVEVVGPKTILTVEVTAFWDPQENRFDPKTIHMKLKPIRFRHQAPMQ
ncbi:uncharacterized protein PG998_008713 [Apiospora kogelbergensis]|uniref:uncharacterized protein n=1 Tax=Apiospora kogelbergensis TaxID=1337665 RepID=UPI00312D73DC